MTQFLGRRLISSGICRGLEGQRLSTREEEKLVFNEARRESFSSQQDRLNVDISWDTFFCPVLDLRFIDCPSHALPHPQSPGPCPKKNRGHLVAAGQPRSADPLAYPLKTAGANFFVAAQPPAREGRNRSMDRQYRSKWDLQNASNKVQKKNSAAV